MLNVYVVDEVEDIPESQSNQIRTDDSNKSSTILVKDSVSDDDGVGTEDDKKITLNGFKYYSDERILLNNIDEKLKVFIIILLLFHTFIYCVICRNFLNNIQV